MNNNKLIVAIGIILTILTVVLVILSIIIFNTKIDNKNNSNSTLVENENINTNEDMNEIDNSSNNAVENETMDYIPNNLIGTLKIPKLNIEAEIAEGTDDSVLANYIGHFENTSKWNGNVALASHNSGTNVVHYFENLNQLIEGDELIYTTTLGERHYKVFSIREITDTDWSITTESNENILTLMTCISGSPEKRLCVQAIEIL